MLSTRLHRACLIATRNQLITPCIFLLLAILPSQSKATESLTLRQPLAYTSSDTTNTNAVQTYGRTDLLAQTAAVINFLQLNRLIKDKDFLYLHTRNFSLDLFASGNLNETHYTNISGLYSTNHFILFGLSMKKTYKSWSLSLQPFGEMGYNQITYNDLIYHTQQYLRQAHILGGAQLSALLMINSKNWLGLEASLTSGTMLNAEDVHYVKSGESLFSGRTKDDPDRDTPYPPPEPMPPHLSGVGLNMTLFAGTKLQQYSTIRVSASYNKNYIYSVFPEPTLVADTDGNQTVDSINFGLTYSYDYVLEKHGLFSPYIRGELEYILNGALVQPNYINGKIESKAKVLKRPAPQHNFSLQGLNYHITIGMHLQPSENSNFKVNSGIHLSIGKIHTIAAHIELRYAF